MDMIDTSVELPRGSQSGQSAMSAVSIEQPSRQTAPQRLLPLEGDCCDDCIRP